LNGPFEEADLSRIKPISIAERRSKISVDDVVDPAGVFAGKKAITAGDLRAALPDLLAADSLKRVVDALHTAREKRREIVWMVGAHTIKCGLSLYLIRLMEAGYVTTLATTGSSAVHDLELAFFGKTSEHVEVELPEGRFGMSAETAGHYNAACAHAAKVGLGLGSGMGDYIEARGAPNRGISVFRGGRVFNIPTTVHVSFGTDVTHQHPGFPAALVGELTMKDFRILTHRVGRMFDGGVVVVFGSAVVLPEVFLKAVSINYNLGRKASAVTAASFDMIPQYRVRENVLGRPFPETGRSYAITGHHEILLPLMYFLLPR